jgi:hypothetical protein
MYEILSKSPERAKRFMGTMAMSLSGPGFKVEHIVENGPWDKLPEGALIVDVGGSHGEVMIALAKKFPNFRLVVQDLPSTIEAAAQQLEPSLEGRVVYTAHDFFTPQPVQHADVFFFRWIFHNWPEKYCLRIIQNLLPALKRGTRIIINEWLLPEPNSVPNRIDRLMR